MSQNINSIQEKIKQIYIENNSSLPSFRQLAKMIGVSSTNTVAYHVNKLKKDGYFSLEKEANAIIKLNIQNLLNLENKKGVFVLLNKKKPFAVFSSENIKQTLLEQLSNNVSILTNELKSHPEKINIAYHLIDNLDERETLKNHLIEFYKKQGMDN